MQFAKADLIAQVEARIKELEAKADQEDTQNRVAWEVARAEWFNEYADQWRAFAHRVLTALDKGEPITKENGSRPHRVHSEHITAYYTGGAGPKSADRRMGNLRDLLAMLQANTRDGVTQAEIERAGFKVADIFKK